MKSFTSICLLVSLAHIALAAEPITLKLWPEGVATPLAEKSAATVKQIASYGSSPTRVSDVTDPEMTVYRPEKPNGAAVIVAPRKVTG